MSVIQGPEQVRVPAVFAQTHELRGPGTMMIAGDAWNARRVETAHQTLQDSTMYNSSTHFHTGGQEMLTLTMTGARPSAIRRVKREHPARLAQGYGIAEGQSTDAMFVGGELRRVSRESLVWIGRALGSAHIDKTYFLHSTIGDMGLAGVSGFDDDSELRHIYDAKDVFGLVPIGGGPEIPYTEAVKIQSLGVRE